VPTQPDVFASWLIDHTAGIFDIWAKRHIHVIRSDSEVHAFDQWLLNYAQAWLEDVPKPLDRAASEWNPPAPVDVQTLLVNLRLRLIKHMEHWKGEARRYVVEQKAHAEAVEAELLAVHSKRLEGAKLADCLREAYDLWASSYARAGQPLTEQLLNQTIPFRVFGAAIQHKWIPYPLVRPVGRRVVGNFLEGWYDRSRSRYVVVPERELTETFGGYKVTKGYEAGFKRILGSRIAFWRAEALRRAAAGGLPQSESPGKLPQPSGGAEAVSQAAPEPAKRSRTRRPRPEEAGKRTLAAIMFTDIVGYSAMTQRDEPFAQEVLDDHNRVLRAIISKHSGTEVNTMGDGSLVEFASALDAVRCAIEVQQTLFGLNDDRPLEKRFQIRIGLHVGDVIRRQNDVSGDAVNIAARIVALAEPGGIWLSENVAREVENKLQVENKPNVHLEKMGGRKLKNIQKPVKLYRVALSS
jgi:class 3 adenylate cyclase